MTSVKNKKSLTEGPIFFRMLLYVIPIMLTGILQLLYNMADHMVVGQFSGDEYALAAVGSTASLTNLIVNLLMGITAGAGVVVARSFGAKDHRTLGRAVHTSLAFAFLGGIVFSIIGLLVSSPALILMGTKEVYLDKAVLYMQIICLGIPASAVYNFGATILRSVGDSKTPLYILSSTGIVNVALNLFFVIVCGMSVEGVALATIISQYLSAATVVFILTRKKDEPYGFSFKRICIDKRLLLQILRFGVPAGIQSSLFSISNIVITAAVNSFPTTTVSAKTIAGNIDGLLYTTLNSYLHASMTFTAQNYGAGKQERVKKSIFFAIIQAAAIGITLGQIMLLVGRSFAGIFVDASDPNKEIIIDSVMDILKVTVSMYFMCGIMETLSGALRGLGYSLSPMLMSLGGVCGLRILWIFTVFPLEKFNTISGLYLCYPITWSATALMLAVTLVIAWKRMGKSQASTASNKS